MDESERIIDVEPKRKPALPGFLRKRTWLEWVLGAIAVWTIFVSNNDNPDDDWQAALLEAVAAQLGPMEGRLMAIEQGQGAAVDPAYLTSFTADVDEMVDITAENAALRTENAQLRDRLAAEASLRAQMDEARETELAMTRAELSRVQQDFDNYATTVVAQQENANVEAEDQVCFTRERFDAFSARVVGLCGSP